MSSTTSHPTRSIGGRAGRFAAGAVFILTPVLIAAAVIVFGVLPQRTARAKLATEAADRAAAPPRVSVVQAKRAPGVIRVTLPGRVEAIQEASVFPREGGYIARTLVDLGDSVKSGQLLAEIETPVLDQEILLNKASVAVAEARLNAQKSQLELAALTLDRLNSVNDSRAVSQQALDEAKLKHAATAADVAAAKASLDYALADGKRLAERKAFSRIVAPFDGKISARGYDAGALVVADKIDATRPLFRLTKIDELRVYVDVPQSAALGLSNDQPAEVRIKELPGKVFPGHVARKSASFDATTRTLLTEVHIDNAEGIFSPGMFAEVTLEAKRQSTPVLIPSEALIVRKEGTRVAVVDANSTLHYVTVTTGRDYGSELEILAELKGDEHVVLSLSRDLPEGSKVDAVLSKR